MGMPPVPVVVHLWIFPPRPLVGVQRDNLLGASWREMVWGGFGYDWNGYMMYFLKTGGLDSTHRNVSFLEFT